MNPDTALSSAAWQVLQNTLWATGLMLPLALLWRRLPVWWRFGLGTVALLRLLLPVTPEFPWSMDALLTRGAFAAPVAEVSGPVLYSSKNNSYPPPSGSAPATGKIAAEAVTEEAAFRPAAVLPAVWLGGVILYGGWLLGHQVLFTRWQRRNGLPAEPRWLAELETCRQAMRLRRPVRIWRVRGLSSPLACGIFRPAILLPSELTQHLTTAEIRHVLRHELAHHRAHDLAWNVLFAAARVLHWFNPLVHFGLRELTAQREILRDADAVRAAPAAEAVDYAETLLKLLRAPQVNRFQTPALTSGFLAGFRHLKQRIAMIPDISSRRPRFTARLTFACAAALLGAVTFTKAQEQASPVKPEVTEVPAQEASDPAQEIRFKAQNIRIPRIQFREATMEQVIQFLRRSSISLDQWTQDPQKKGVDFILTGAGEERITCDLRDIIFIDAVRAICKLGNCRYRIDPNAILISHNSGKEPVQVQTRIFRTPPGFAELTNWDPSKMEDYLKRLGNATGIEFPEGSSASLSTASNRIVVRSSLDALDGIEIYLDEAFRMPRNIDLFLTKEGISSRIDGIKSLMEEKEVKASLEAAVKKADAKSIPHVIIWTDPAVQIDEAAKLMVTARSAGIQAITVQPLKASAEE